MQYQSTKSNCQTCTRLQNYQTPSTALQFGNSSPCLEDWWITMKILFRRRWIKCWRHKRNKSWFHVNKVNRHCLASTLKIIQSRSNSNNLLIRGHLPRPGVADAIVDTMSMNTRCTFSTQRCGGCFSSSGTPFIRALDPFSGDIRYGW